jgi:Antibiotic biosynthesis monooxygenase
VEIGLFDHEPAVRAGATVYRALRADVAFRYVAIGPGASYEVAYEEGDVDGAGGVVLIEPFAVPPGDDDGFLAAWREAHAALAGRPGHLGARLYRGLAPAEPRWVEMARWSSPLLFARAGGRGALYLPVDE